MPNKPRPEFDIEFIKRFIKLSAKEKLERLEALNAFFQLTMPGRSMEIWQQMKRKGW